MSRYLGFYEPTAPNTVDRGNFKPRTAGQTADWSCTGCTAGVRAQIAKFGDYIFLSWTENRTSPNYQHARLITPQAWKCTGPSMIVSILLLAWLDSSSSLNVLYFQEIIEVLYFQDIGNRTYTTRGWIDGRSCTTSHPTDPIARQVWCTPPKHVFESLRSVLAVNQNDTCFHFFATLNSQLHYRNDIIIIIHTLPHSEYGCPAAVYFY